MNKETKVINKGIKIIRFSVIIKMGGGEWKKQVSNMHTWGKKKII